jgi:hypothetical protein
MSGFVPGRRARDSWRKTSDSLRDAGSGEPPAKFRPGPRHPQRGIVSYCRAGWRGAVARASFPSPEPAPATGDETSMVEGVAHRVSPAARVS